MNIKKKIQPLLLTLALSTCLAVPAFAQATPKAESVITHDQITLGDVFDGVTDDADHYLAPAPDLGKTMTLSTHDLTRISDAFSLGWSPSDGAIQHVTIRRANNEIDRFDIQAALEKKLTEQMNGQKFQMDIASSTVGFHVPETTDRTVTVDRLSYDAGTSTYKATISAAAAPDIKKEVNGHYYAISSIPVLKSPLRPGDVISANDIDYVDMISTAITPAMITEAANLIGHSPRRGIIAMKPVTSADVQMPIIVKKGDIVTMVLKNSTLSLTAQGRAMENGAVGDTVHVMNSSSKQIVDATVSGTETVDIKLPTSTL